MIKEVSKEVTSTYERVEKTRIMFNYAAIRGANCSLYQDNYKIDCNK